MHKPQLPIQENIFMNPLRVGGWLITFCFVGSVLDVTLQSEKPIVSLSFLAASMAWLMMTAIGSSISSQCFFVSKEDASEYWIAGEDGLTPAAPGYYVGEGRSTLCHIASCMRIVHWTHASDGRLEPFNFTLRFNEPVTRQSAETFLAWYQHVGEYYTDRKGLTRFLLASNENPALPFSVELSVAESVPLLS